MRTPPPQAGEDLVGPHFRGELRKISPIYPHPHILPYTSPPSCLLWAVIAMGSDLRQEAVSGRALVQALQSEAKAGPLAVLVLNRSRDLLSQDSQHRRGWSDPAFVLNTNSAFPVGSPHPREPSSPLTLGSSGFWCLPDACELRLPMKPQNESNA
jgi:hypothetical protein